jgi:hypothetical protein
MNQRLTACHDWICRTLMPREVYLIAAMVYLALC